MGTAKKKNGGADQSNGAPRPVMKIAFVVNDVTTEEAAYTTMRLAMTAVNLGHKTFLFGVGDFVHAADGAIHARAHDRRQELQVAREVPQGIAI